MAECTKIIKLTTLSLCQKNGAYLENVVECLTVRKMSGGNTVEVFQTTPLRKHSHSVELLISDI